MGNAVIHSKQQPSLDRLFKLLANRRRRYTLYYLEMAETPVVTLDDLAAQVVQWECQWDDRGQTATDTHREQICVDLHHNQLPRLAAAGLIDYDARTQTIRQWDDPSLVEWAQSDIDELPRLRALLTTADR